MPLRAGQLNERVTLQRATDAPDGQGGTTRTWANFATAPEVWAKVRTLAGSEREESSQTVARARYEVTIRRRSDVQAGDRVIRGTSILAIVAPPDDASEDRDALVLTCEADGATT